MIEDRNFSSTVTIGLMDGQTKTGRIARFAPAVSDYSLEIATKDASGNEYVSKIRIRAEKATYVGFHTTESPQARRTDKTDRRLRIHVAGGVSFLIDAPNDSDLSNRIGFYARPAEGATPFKELFFYAHGVNAKESSEPIGELLVKDGVIRAEQLQSGIAAQQAIRNVPIGQILIEQRKITQTAVEKAALLQTRRQGRIGEILVEAGLCTPQDIELALGEQKKRAGKRLGEVLVHMDVVSEEDLAITLAKKFHIPFVDLTTCTINEEAAREVTLELIAKYGVLPVDTGAKTLTVAISDPLAMEAIDMLRFQVKKHIDEILVTPTQLKTFVQAFLARVETEAKVAENSAGKAESLLKEMAADDMQTSADAEATEKEAASGDSDSAVVKFANQVILDAIRRGASDIHIEPNGKDRNMRIRFRIDGECVAYQEVPASYRTSLVARLKIMAELDIAEKRKPQDGKIRFRTSDDVVELRIATIPTVNGNEDVVLRILAASKPLPLEQMGLAARNLRELRRISASPYGLILCVGPTGSGKTTTLHSTLGAINTVDMKIWTAEDPVEITQPGLRQVQVNAKIGFTFAAAMRAFLRADPDVIMVGEMRDHETASTAVEASLTGHLVFSTLHTNTAPETITRLLDMGLDPFSFSDALVGVLAQRLIRTLCTRCRESYPGTREEYAELAGAYGESAFRSKFGVSVGEGFTMWRAPGCEACGQSGYKGRGGLHELLVTNDPMKVAISRKAPVDEIRRLAVEGGMTTLLQDGIEKVMQGVTDMRQVLAVCSR